jgi:deoxyribodipyrimidine photo-lyase
MNSTVNIFWFRRDLRLDDNAGLFHALQEGNPVTPLFIFDTDILDKLENKKDQRVVFIHQRLAIINDELKKYGSNLLIRCGKPVNVWKNLINEFKIKHVFTNHDYEPYAIERDLQVEELLKSATIGFHTFKDQIIFEKNEILKDDGKPYTVFTAFKNKWKKTFNENHCKSFDTKKYFENFLQTKNNAIIPLGEIGFENFKIDFPKEEPSSSLLKNYSETRDIPSIEGTSRMSVHLRFGTISIRHLVSKAWNLSETYINELIWREFYMYILWHYPYVVNSSFKQSYDMLKWLNNEDAFQKWCEGQTGYPIVDAGMRQLNETGFMHNRLRMITSMFLTKYLLIDWRWGEAYFAEKLLDYELASNNGGWQWSAGTGVDAAPYFRIFNMDEQTRRFDPEFLYIKKWVPEVESDSYPERIIDYNFARKRCLDFYKNLLK